MSEFIITLLFGWLGVHKFIQKKYVWGVVYLCTFGLCGVGWCIDTITAFTKLLKSKQVEQENGNSVNACSGGGGTTYTPTQKQLVKSFNTVIVGTFAKCDLDPSEKREDVIYRVKKNAKLDLEFWRYKGEPAYYVCYYGIDLGNVRAGLAKILYEEYNDCTFEVTAIEKTLDERNDCMTYNIRIDIYK